MYVTGLRRVTYSMLSVVDAKPHLKNQRPCTFHAFIHVMSHSVRSDSEQQTDLDPEIRTEN